MTNRTIARVLQGQPASDGGGVRLTRVISPNQGLDPFLLLDEFDSAEASDYLAGFPAHPHRGFETVTYMLDGHMLHEDHLGNRGHLRPGGVQWMTAGRGIIHSEMPQQEAGRMRGFQLWINLPGRDKMKAAAYRDLEPAQIPTAVRDGARIRVVAGSLAAGVEVEGGIAAHGGASGDGPGTAGASGGTVTGPISGGATEPLYFDVAVDAGRSVTLPVPATHQTLAYTFEGAPRVGGRELPKGSLGILVNGDAVQVEAGDAPVRVLLIAGRPLREPVVHYGPFVMNTVPEIEQAIRDYQAGTLTAAA
jgi:redox-sensitive bicupin YhaK (pirin superfamily)